VSNLTLRLLSAAVLLPLVITACVLGGWWVRGMVFFAAVGALYEYGRVVLRGDGLARALLMVTGAGATSAALLVSDAVVALLAVQASVLVFGANAVLRPRADDLPDTFRQLGLSVFGVVYIALGVFAVARLRDMGDAFDGVARGSLILVAFVATWANDTCAYFAGRFLGKHKMAGPISPKKTWEGFAGGFVGTPLFLLGGRLLFPTMFAHVGVVDIACVSVGASFLGPMGDLVESLWKRAYDVKDSSNLIPGHGGILDRIDALFFVAPWVLGYFTALKPLLGPLAR
jgi:phosphatidate cytidylyltransferase